MAPQLGSHPIMYRNAFLILGALGAILLQGLLAVDGGLFAILKTILHRQFPNGRPMALVYTGLPLVDQFANIQVAFWDPVVSSDGIPRLQACMLCASLQVAGVWALIESFRRDSAARSWIITYAPLYVFLWQGVGTAIFLPIYFVVELSRWPRQADTAEIYGIPLPTAVSILPATALALAQPFAMVFHPSASLTRSQQQTNLAIYQFGPLIAFALITTFSALLPRSLAESSKRKADVSYIKMTYVTCAALSLLVHVTCLWTAYAGTTALSKLGPSIETEPHALDLPLNLATMFVPSLNRVMTAGQETLMTHASLFFLQWDFIICALACALYADAVARRMVAETAASSKHIQSVSAFLVGCVVLSPGFVVSMVLYFRENTLRRDEIDGPVERSSEEEQEGERSGR